MKKVAAAQLSVSPYPCLSSTHGNLSLNLSDSSLLNGASPEPTLFNEDKSHLTFVACFTRPSITGGAAGLRIAPMVTGNKIEFGDKRNTTSPFRTPRPLYKPEARTWIGRLSCA